MKESQVGVCEYATGDIDPRFPVFRLCAKFAGTYCGCTPEGVERARRDGYTPCVLCHAGKLKGDEWKPCFMKP